MHIKLNRQAFLTKLNLINKNAGKGNKTQSGVESFVYLKVMKDKKISIRSWNGTTFLVTSLSGEAIKEIEGNGTMLIRVDKLLHVVSSSSTENITIEETSPTHYKVKGNGRSEVSGLPLETFPKPNADGKQVAEYDMAKFVSKLEKVILCTGNALEQQANPIISGVCINGDVVATDGSSKISVVSGEKMEDEYVVPAPTIELLIAVQKELPSTKISLLAVEKKNMIFKMDDVTIISPLLTGKYPDYAKLIEKVKTLTNSVTFERKEMLEILQRCSIFEDRNRAVLLTGKEGKLTAKIGHEEAHTEAVKTAKNVSNFELYFRTDNFNNGVRLAPDEITLKFGGQNDPIALQHKKWTFLLMPMIKGV